MGDTAGRTEGAVVGNEMEEGLESWKNPCKDCDVTDGCQLLCTDPANDCEKPAEFPEAPT
jgi:hypothetical protein